MSNQSNQKNQNSKKPRNFAEALLELSGQTPKPNQNNIEAQKSDDSHKVEHDWKNHLRLERHKEVTETSVFSREQEEVQKKIAEVQDELKKLAKELSLLATDIDIAINQNVTNPGTYHVHFFESLRRFLYQLRKQVSESKDWLAISQQRKASQNHYWGGVKKSGTSFMLSSERTIATQSG